MPPSTKTEKAPAVGALASYRQPSGMSAAGPYAALLRGLPIEVAQLCQVVQGLFVHEYMADAYGFQVPASRKAESHLRSLEAMLERLM